MKEVVRVANGVGSEDAVSILHVKVPEHHQALTLAAVSILLQTCGDFHVSLEYFAIGQHGSGANKETMLILQNSCYDASGSFMVYSSLDKHVMEMITSPGGEEAMSNIALFPAGFSLVPLADPADAGSPIGEAGGTVMTAGFQILMKLARGTGLCPRSVSSAIQIMTENIATIKDTLMNSHPVFYKTIQTPN